MAASGPTNTSKGCRVSFCVWYVLLNLTSDVSTSAAIFLTTKIYLLKNILFLNSTK